MPELTLNEPLSGLEIRDIILQEIGKRLDGDCTLLEGLAYAGFKADFEIKIGYLRSQTGQTLVWGSAAGGDPVGAPDETTHISDTHKSNDSPNIERQDHDLAIPVMVATPSGNERRKVKIEKPGGRK